MSLKSTVIEKCPDTLFAIAWHLFKEKKTGIKIGFGYFGVKWLISDINMTIGSPTAKFTSFGLKQFEDKFEKYFKIDKGDICLDVGACIGDTTVPMIFKTESEGIVYAVEPNRLNFEYLLANTHAIKYCIQIQKAIWKSKGQLTFHEHSSPTGHSLIPLSLRKKESIVECDTLDNLFKGIVFDFAKIDVQSAELEVLQGANRFLETTRKLVIECHHDYKDELHDTSEQVGKILKLYYTNMAYSKEYNLWYAWK
jgi:FkbM family methyltransferase